MQFFDEHLTDAEIEKLKSITKKFRIELNQINLKDKFKTKIREIDQYRKYSENYLDVYYWNKALEYIKVELFPIFLAKFELTPRQEFMVYTFNKCKPYFSIREDNFYLHRYILSDGKGGINNLNNDAFNYNSLMINKNKPYDLIIFLYYFKEYYPISDLILENLNFYIDILQEQLNNSRINVELDIIHYYYLEWHHEWKIPKLKFYDRSKRFYYIHIQDCLVQCLRRSENLLRTHLGFKKIGEGYLREQIIFNELIKFINQRKIKRCYRPEWLSGLELDFYFKIGSREYAIEHQGEQHIKAVSFFGGQFSFQNQIKRDRKKLDICIERNIKLYYCYFDDDLKEFFRKIKEELNINDG